MRATLHVSRVVLYFQTLVLAQYDLIVHQFRLCFLFYERECIFFWKFDVA
jgi:hypothetical protein